MSLASPPIYRPSEVEVQDSGAGVDDKDLDRTFPAPHATKADAAAHRARHRRSAQRPAARGQQRRSVGPATHPHDRAAEARLASIQDRVNTLTARETGCSPSS
jgi:hypothetical protein